MNNRIVFGSRISVNFPLLSSSCTNSKVAGQSYHSRSPFASSSCNAMASTNQPKPSPKLNMFYGGPPPDLIRQDSKWSGYPESCKNRPEDGNHGNEPKKSSATEKANLNNFWLGFPRRGGDGAPSTATSEPKCGQGEYLMDKDIHKIDTVSSQGNISEGIHHPIPIRLNDPSYGRLNTSPNRFLSPSQYSYGANQPRRGPQLSGGTKSRFQSPFSQYLGYEDSPKDHHHKKAESPTNDVVAEQRSVELKVTNLDQNIDVHHLKKLLFSIFNEHVMVLHVSVNILMDGNYVALVKVGSTHDAQYAISKLHRKKIGFKRILICVDNDQHVVPIAVLRHEVGTLLNEIPNSRLPLFKFRELFEKRYHRSVSISDLSKIKDTILIDEDGRGRMVEMNPEYKQQLSQSPTFAAIDEKVDMDKCYCELHYSPESVENVGWAEKNVDIVLPDVCIPLKLLSMRIHALLHSHDGVLPLASVEWCYRSEFGPFVRDGDQDGKQDGNMDCENAFVPLEHLISCIQGVEIFQMATGYKRIQWAENRASQGEEANTCTAPTSALASQLILFGREIVDLLKNSAKCQMLFNKFIPSYHHHFGRQCRVADYGYTKLADLMVAVQHIVQILGIGNKKILTLTHQSQVKRFTSDLLRVLKSQPNKQMLLSSLATVYHKVFDKHFSISEYGVSSVLDILSEVSDGIVLVSETGQGLMVSIPRRDQTPEEMDRTKQFAAEVVELIRHSPQCCMEFNKFIPAYHHHFGKQCRVADYGFGKLIELFEAIPDIVQVTNEGDDKILHLTESEALKVLAEQLIGVVKSHQKRKGALPLCELNGEYVAVYGFGLKPQDYNADNLRELLLKIRHAVKVVETGREPIITIVDKGYAREISLRVRQLLMEQMETKMAVRKLCDLYKQTYYEDVDMNLIKNELQDVCVIEGPPENAIIRLTMIQIFARDVHILLHDNGGHIIIGKFEKLYSDRFGVPCRPAVFAKANLIALLQSIPDVASLKGRGAKKMLVLNKETAGSPLKLHAMEKVKSLENLMDLKGQSPVDFLAQPVPSSVPSPQLHPDPNLTEGVDLIRFETPISREMLIEEEMTDKCRLKTPPLVPNNDLYDASPSKAKDEAINALLYRPSSYQSLKDSQPSVVKTSNVTPPPSMLPHPTQLLASSLPSPKALHSSYDCYSGDSSSDSLCQHPISSSQSTPTRNAPGRQSKSRIAANFMVSLT